MIGTTLLHFEIVEKLGEGGMGEVYRAEDSRLGRSVAIKVLPAGLVAEPERLARLEREARVLAALNHPNLAAIYEFGEAPAEEGSAGSVHFLVMELAEGRDLAARLKEGPLPADEAANIALQVATALEVAHERGIVHRDLKPANIMLGLDGQVKVLDFGLAKARETDSQEASTTSPANSPTLTAPQTLGGVLLGTAGYMSPEQAKGLPVDKRSDIWAFGVVLWEMLTGTRLFAGESVSETLAAVLRDPVPPADALVEIPRPFGRLIGRCLERDERRRLRDIGEARIALEDFLDSDGKAEAEAPPPPARSTRFRERSAWAVAALALVVTFSVWWRAGRDPAGVESVHFAVTMRTGQSLSLGDQPILALSPDGRKLAYLATDPESGWSMIHLRRLDQLEPVVVPGTEGASHPFFSPDGSSLAFFAEHRLKKVSLEAGGGVITLAEAPNPRGGVWGSDDSILFAPGYDTPLVRIAASDGSGGDVLAPNPEEGERTYRWPELLPGGQVAIFTVGALTSPNAYDDAVIVAHDFESGQRHVLVEGGSMARFVAPDKLVYLRSGRLFVVPFDAVRLEVAGDPRPVVDGVAGDPSSGAAFFSVASSGTLAYVPGSSALFESYLVFVDRQGDPSRVPLSPRGFKAPRFSPAGSRRIAFGVGEGLAGAQGDVWVYSLATGSLDRLTFAVGMSHYPIWSSDGSRIAFLQELTPNASGAREPGGIYALAADGSDDRELLVPFGRAPLMPGDWSPDGTTLAYNTVGLSDVFLLDLESGSSKLFESNASAPTFSPNGRWLAYQSPAAGNAAVFVRSVKGPGKWQVSPGQGAYPRWSSDGRELFYIDSGKPERPLMVVDVAEGEAFRPGPSRTLLPDLSRFTTATSPSVNWDVAPDGKSFVFVELARDEVERSRIEVVVDWVAGLGADGS